MTHTEQETLQQTTLSPEKRKMTAGELARRTALGTFLASVVMTALANMSDRVDGIPIKFAGKKSTEHTQTIPGTVLETPSRAVVTHTGEGPRVTLEDVLEEHSPEFKRIPLNEAQKQEIADYVEQLEALRDNDPSMKVKLFVSGRASDEDYTRSVRGDRNLGVASPDNETLAETRADLVADYLQDYMQQHEIDNIEIVKVSGEEVILDTATIREMEQIAKRNGKTLDEFVSDFNHHRAGYLSDNERGLMIKALVENRGARIDSKTTIEYSPVGPCDEVVEEHIIPEKVNTWTEPGHEGGQFELFPMPMFIPRRPRRRTKHADGAGLEVPAAEVPTVEAPVVEAGAATEGIPADANDTDTTSEDGNSKSVANATQNEEAAAASPAESVSEAPVSTQRSVVSPRTTSPERASRSMSQAEKNRRASLYLTMFGGVVAAGVSFVALGIPISDTATEKADNTPPDAERCEVIDVRQGERIVIKKSTLGEAAWAFLHGDDIPWETSYGETTPTTIDTTHIGHYKFVVTPDGKIVRKDFVPPVTTTELVTPSFE